MLLSSAFAQESLHSTNVFCMVRCKCHSLQLRHMEQVGFDRAFRKREGLDVEGVCPLILRNVIHTVLVNPSKAGGCPLPSFSRQGPSAGPQGI